MRYIITVLLVLFLSGPSGFAQQYLKNRPDSVRSFRQLQRDFYEWKKEKNISKIRGWKSFKRFEQEAQMHTNGHGEQDGVEAYLNAMIQAAAEKSSARSTLASAPWFPVGPYTLPNNLTGYMTNGMGRVNCIAFDPVNPAVFYIGVGQGGLWKTTNNGISYTALTDNLPITRISDIAIDPTNTNTLYISLCDFEYVGTSLFTNGRKRNTHYGLGVYKSTDGGLTWAPTGLSFQLSNGDASLIRKIIVDPANSNNVVACGVSGMYKSLNGGTTFTQINDSLYWDMLQDPANPNVLYAATGWIMVAGIGSANIFKSTDFGSTWTLLNTGIPPTGSVQRVKLAQSHSNPSILYALGVDTQGGSYAVYKSTDSGVTWTTTFSGMNILGYDDVTSPGGQGNYDLGLAVDPQNPDRLIAGGVNLWVSDDGGINFNPASHWTTSYGPSIHADIHDIKFHPSTGYLYVCNDGGVNRTQNLIPESWVNLNLGTQFQTMWSNLSNGMNTTSFYRISSSKSNTDELIAGAQDNATFYFDGANWMTVFGGDGMDNLMDTTQQGYFIASSQYGNFSQTTDGGNSFNGIFANVNNENAEWTSPIAGDPSDPLTMYCGFQNVTVSYDGGLFWNATTSLPLPPNFYGNELSALAVSPVTSGVLWAGRRVRYEFANPAALFLSTNDGQSWTDVTSNLPDSLYYTSLEADRFNAAAAYVSMAGFVSGQKVYKTTTNGNAWTNISYNLPNIPVNCIKQIPGKQDLLAATDIGIYLLPAGSTSWINVSTGLPNVIVTDIEFNITRNKVFISTFGRGIWSTDLSLLTGLTHPEQVLLDFRLTPTLNNGHFSITINEAVTTPASLEILDVSGKCIDNRSLSKGTTEIGLSLPGGTYFARLRSEKKLGVARFIVTDPGF